MVQITGSYTQTSAENYEELLKALNVGFMLRKAALASTPTMTITNDGGNWTMCTKTTMKSVELKFKLGEEFEEETTDRSVASIPCGLLCCPIWSEGIPPP